MAGHKVPSDVETADKLIGFLSLKQFLFVLAAAGLSFIAFSFAKATPLLAIPFLPFIIALLVLGLYQKKDQPVEVFLAAWVKFKLSPKVKIWNQEGYEQHIIVAAPKKEIIDYTKGLSRKDVLDRFSGLGSTLDTRGWAVKGVSGYNISELDSRSETLLSDDQVRSIVEAYDMSKTEEGGPEDIFDANNSKTAAELETALDRSTVSQEHHTSSKEAPQTGELRLNPHQREALQNISTADVPISTAADQARKVISPKPQNNAGMLDLASLTSQGSEFQLR